MTVIGLMFNYQLKSAQPAINKKRALKTDSHENKIHLVDDVILMAVLDARYRYQFTRNDVNV